ncbi:hypothetical protein GTQ40_06655 [Flavobacteriaceae bacterium R38]|nr:hypothetical protein [Flavobacteriaceae bacterium R38]
MKLYQFLDQPKVRKHLTIIFTGFLLGFLIYLFLVYTEDRNTLALVLSGFIGVVVAYLATVFSKWLNKLISWKAHTGLRLLTGTFSVTIIAFLIWLLGIYGLTFLTHKSDNFWEDYWEHLLKLVILLFSISLIYNIIYFAIYSYYQYVKGQLQSVQLERKQTALQLEALKSQLSPHFLFNSINTVSSLLFKDVTKAALFIRKLAYSYQYTLNNYENQLVTVEEELTFVNSYVFLVKTRFGNHLSFDAELPEDVLTTKIPPLTLQILVENAVKHNQMSESQKLNIKIATEKDQISISNNKTIVPNRVESFKIGLNNITSRYRLLVNKKIEIINDDQFIVRLPYIR